MTEVRARMRGNNYTTFPTFSFLPPVIAGKEFLRFPFGENEARCFAVQYVNETAYHPYPTAKIAGGYAKYPHSQQGNYGSWGRN